ncbi:uncharacterized protein LOC108115435 [Drosophila eugracilis]|uniref:uncharacterized protein LOC108115435 n=1 Tax=Drosophila eugracilis TaxID=29029 RepID=UPI001BDB2264|nr:uncharacterized protein LOC108115435 [Drosophila eugracilis]
MANNSSMIHKTKSSRLENPSIAQTYKRQVNQYGLVQEKIPKMSNNRRTKSSKQLVPEPSTSHNKDITHKKGTIQDISRISHRLESASVAPKPQTRVTLNNQPSKAAPLPVTKPSSQKLTPREIGELKETTKIKLFKDLKEIRGINEPKKFKELREYKESRELKDLKGTKDVKLKGVDKPANPGHRSTRHNSNRTNNFFDKYLKFAFDLSTPEGVKKLEEHFFPNQSVDPTATDSSNLKRKNEVKK